MRSAATWLSSSTRRPSRTSLRAARARQHRRKRSVSPWPSAFGSVSLESFGLSGSAAAKAYGFGYRLARVPLLLSGSGGLETASADNDLRQPERFGEAACLPRALRQHNR